MKRPQRFRRCNLLYVVAALIVSVTCHIALQAQTVAPPYNRYTPASGPQNPCPNYPYSSHNIMAEVTNNHPDLVMLADHRGGWYGSTIPENSLTAIAAACAANWELVELDIKETADGVPILLHDYNLGRNTSFNAHQYCLDTNWNTLNCRTPITQPVGKNGAFSPSSANSYDSAASWTPWNQDCSNPYLTICNPLASSQRWPDLWGSYVRNAEGEFTGDYLAAFDDALLYHIQQNLQIVYVLDIKTQQALFDCWTLVKGRNAGGFVIFKINGTVFPRGFNQLATFLKLQTSDYSNFHLIPIYTTNMIDQLANAPNESIFNQIEDYGSNALIIREQTGSNFLSGIEVNLKCPPGSGGTAPDISTGTNDGCNLQNELWILQQGLPQFRAGIFNAIPDADAPDYNLTPPNWTQGTYQLNPSNYTAYFLNTGTCCYLLSSLLQPVATNNGALDPEDDRGNPSFLSFEHFNLITSDNPANLATYFASLGKRNTIYMTTNYQPR